MRFDRKNRASWLLAVLLAHSGDSWWWLTALFLIWLVDKFWKVFAGQAVEFAALLQLRFYHLPFSSWLSNSSSAAAARKATGVTSIGAPIRIPFRQDMPPAYF